MRVVEAAEIGPTQVVSRPGWRGPDHALATHPVAPDVTELDGTVVGGHLYCPDMDRGRRATSTSGETAR